MPGNFKQYDLRIIKTNKALLEALPELLSRRKFGRITVNDICEESQMSRTAFYSHFNDKYDLLKRWLSGWLPDITPIRNNYTEIEKSINKIINENKNIITNLLEDADNETMGLINEFVSDLLIEFMECDDSDLKKKEPFNIVLYNFCAGGIINLVLWQIENKFPADFKTMNVHFYRILDILRQLKNNNSDGGVKNGE